MKYLKRFHVKLKEFRQSCQLTSADIAQICSVDSKLAEAWEIEDENKRSYPSLENLLDLCFKSGKALEYFIEVPNAKDNEQLELPGLAPVNDDLSDSLTALNKQIDKLIPSEDEQELLRRYRKSDAQAKELLLQLIAN